MSEDKTAPNKICRLCAQLIKEAKAGNIFNDSDLAQKINSTLPIRVDSEDGLPQFICVECEVQLKSYSTFVSNVVKADKILRTKGEATNDHVNKTIEEIFGVDSDDDLKDLKLPDEVKNKERSLDREEAKKLKLDESDITIKPKDICQKCGMLFQNSSLLQEHYKIKHPHGGEHSPKHELIKNEKPVKQNTKDAQGVPVICSKCNKIFLNTEALVKHQHNKHSSKVCTYCWSTFENVSAYNMHIYQHNNSNFQQCAYCNKMYNTPRGLKKHTLQQHGEEVALLMDNSILSNEI